MEIFKLVGSIMVDSKEAENSISKTGEKADGLASKLGKGIATAGKWAAGITAGAAAVGTAMLAAAKDSAANMDEIDKASQRMGIAAEAYQELAHAASLSGVEMSTMEKAAKKLTGTGIGFEEALDQIMAFETAEERSAAAAELFGDSVAYELTPMLNAGADGLAAMRQEANDLGLVMSDESVAAGAALNDQFGKLEETFGTLKNTLIVELMPYLVEILDWIVENLPMIKESVGNLVNALMPIIQSVFNIIMEALPYITMLIEGVISLINGDVEGFVENFKAVFSKLAEVAVDIGKKIMNAIWTGLKSVWDSISNWFSDKINSLFGKIGDLGSKVTGWFSHAGGIATVPYDNYPAMLHKNETVLNASDTSSLIELLRNGTGGSGDSAPINITIQSVLDGRIISETVTKYQRSKARAYG